MRWRLRLGEFHFVIQYRNGCQHHAADALSRLTTSGETEPEIDDDIPFFAFELPSPDSIDADFL